MGYIAVQSIENKQAVISQKIQVFVTTGVKTSNPACKHTNLGFALTATDQNWNGSVTF
jgi:hypothetical protein